MTVSRRLSVGTKHCLTYSTKVSPFHWPFENERRHHPVMAQAGHEGNCFPMPVRRVSDQSRAARTATSQPHHIGAGGGLVDKDKPRRIKQTFLSNPAPARTGHVRSLLLGSVQAFF